MDKRRILVAGAVCAVCALAFFGGIVRRTMEPHGVYEAGKIGYLGRKFIEFRNGEVSAVTGFDTNLLGNYYRSNRNWYYVSSDGEYSTRLVPNFRSLRAYDSNNVEEVDFKLMRLWSFRSP